MSIMTNDETDGVPVEVDEDEGETEALPVETMSELVFS